MFHPHMLCLRGWWSLKLGEEVMNRSGVCKQFDDLMIISTSFVIGLFLIGHDSAQILWEEHSRWKWLRWDEKQVLDGFCCHSRHHWTRYLLTFESRSFSSEPTYLGQHPASLALLPTPVFMLTGLPWHLLYPEFAETDVTGILDKLHFIWNIANLVGFL